MPDSVVAKGLFGQRLEPGDIVYKIEFDPYVQIRLNKSREFIIKHISPYGMTVVLSDGSVVSIYAVWRADMPFD